MSTDVGGGGATAVAAVAAAKLRGTKIWEGWVANIPGEGIYLYNVEPVSVPMGRCSCGGRVKVVRSRGGNYFGSMPEIQALDIGPGCAERIIMVIPED